VNEDDLRAISETPADLDQQAQAVGLFLTGALLQI
jgi:hypothetical protein